MYVCNARKGTMMIKGESVQQSGVGVGGGEEEVVVEFKILYSRILSFSSYFLAAYTFRRFSTWLGLEVV